MNFETIKRKWYIIVIAILLLFSLNKCTQSCNRATTIDENTKTIAQRDSVIASLNDSIVKLNQQIELLNNDKVNQQKLVDTQQDAINKINEAKKNINVTVKR